MSDLMFDVGLVNELKLVFRKFNWKSEEIKELSKMSLCSILDNARGYLRYSPRVAKRHIG